MAATAGRHVFIPPLDDCCEIGEPDYLPGHYGHHRHIEGNAFVCSCGELQGVFTIVPPDPEEWARHVASISCSICGNPGVVAEEDWGTTPGP